MSEGKGESEANELNEISSETEKLFDVMDKEEKATNDLFVKGYCLYKHMANRFVFYLNMRGMSICSVNFTQLYKHHSCR